MISDSSAILAITPPESVKEQFSEHMDETATTLGLHLTIANLGDVKSEDVARCISVLYKKMQTLSPINIEYAGEGALTLPGNRFASVALVSGKGLDVWRYELAQLLEDEGILTNEIDAFHPHMTVAYTEDGGRVLPPNFGFKPFTVDKVHFLRGLALDVPIHVQKKRAEKEEDV